MTKSSIVQLAVAVLLIAGGVVLLARGEREQQIAEAERALLTLRYERAAANERTRSAAEYWRGNYEAVPADADPLVAANASFRAAMAPGGPAKEVVGRLDAVVKQYADVLRNDPGNEHAAFNYEFAVRLRAAIAARGVPLPPAEDSNATLHGIVGAPPPGKDMKQFKMIVPMRPDERQEAEEAGRAARKVRKG
jgi:hypothetical protein